MYKLHKRVWPNNNLTVNTKMRVYRACVLSTLLYSSETWTTYAAQEKRLNSFHLRCLRRILSIRWQDKIPNTVVLERAGLPSIFMLLSQRRLRWLGHVRRMADGRIPKLQRLAVRGTLKRCQIQRPPKTAFQRHLQERPEECINRHPVMGKPRGV